MREEDIYIYIVHRGSVLFGVTVIYVCMHTGVKVVHVTEGFYFQVKILVLLLLLL